MQAHPHAQRPADRPGMIVQRRLRDDCAADRVLHAAERDEESIAGGAEFMAGVLGDGVAKDATMLLQRGVIPVRAQLRQPGRRVLDVAEEEGDRWVWRSWGAGAMTTVYQQRVDRATCFHIPLIVDDILYPVTGYSEQSPFNPFRAKS